MSDISKLPESPSSTAPYFDALQSVAGKLATAAGYAAAQENEANAWKQEALVDSLTGLGTRRALERDMQTEPLPRAVLKVDGDVVGLINKRLGDDRGDTAVRSLADFLKHSVRPWDKLYRTGGDEMLVVYRDRPADYDATRDSTVAQGGAYTPKQQDLSPAELLPVVTQRANKQLATFLNLPENRDLQAIGFGLSIGGAVYEEGMTVKEMFTEADRHMQEVKLENLRELDEVEIPAARAAITALRSIGMDPGTLAKYDRAGYFDQSN